MNGNQYGILRDDVPDSELNQRVKRRRRGDNTADINQPVIPTVTKPPPITVSDIRISELKKSMSELELSSNDIYFKLIRDDVQVFVSNVDDFKKIRDHFQKNDYHYNTHPLKDDKNVKVCLFGLPEVSIDELKVELKNYNLVPHDIKTIIPIKGGGSRIYVLFFKRHDGIKISTLRTITGIANIRVRWEYYSPRKHTPTQCARCQAFGHGQAFCNRPFKCVSCGMDHDSKSCPARKPVPKKDPKDPDTKPRVPDNLVKCCNCGGNHTSNWSRCKFRIAYQQRIQQSRKPRQKPTPLAKDDFPDLPLPYPDDIMQMQKKYNPLPGHSRNVWHDDSPSHTGITELLQQQQQQMFQMMTNMINTMMSRVESMFMKVIQNLANTNSNKNDKFY